MSLTLATAGGLRVLDPPRAPRPVEKAIQQRAKSARKSARPRGSGAVDPALLDANARERGMCEALGLTLAGFAASAVIAGAAAAHDVVDVAEVSAGLYNSGKDIGMGMSGMSGTSDDAKAMKMSPTSKPRAGEPKGSHASPAWEIWAYSQAAPPYIGDGATVVGGDGEIKRAGTNEWTCLAGNGRARPADGWPSVHVASPICADPEGMKWIQAYVSGKTPKLERDTVSS